MSRRPGPLLAAILLGALVVAFAAYIRPFKAATPSALLSSDASIEVERRSFGEVFMPKSGTPAVGLVFYPEARVPGDAYAYLGRAAAQAGYLAVVLSFPLGFAVFAPDEAAEAEKAFPDVKAWAVGGHSLGGTMAASFCAEAERGAAKRGGRPEKLGGLILLAAYPDAKADLSAAPLPVLSISASEDGLATPAKVGAARKYLPASCRYVTIGGGNHAQFGDYGSQPGDGIASAPADLQRKAVVEESLAFMDKILSGLN